MVPARHRSSVSCGQCRHPRRSLLEVGYSRCSEHPHPPAHMIRGHERHLDEINKRGVQKLRRKGRIPISGHRELDFSEFGCQNDKAHGFKVVCRIEPTLQHATCNCSSLLLSSSAYNISETLDGSPVCATHERNVCQKAGEMI
jgi:hypothetical protein